MREGEAVTEELPLKDPQAPKPLTSRDVCDLIYTKYGADGSHLVMYDIPDNVGTDSKRRADAIVIGNWGSTGRLVHGMEIKVSRSDWLRELKQTEKADPWIARCDRWWLVTADDKMAKPEEIPHLWGWMCATKKGGLRIQKPAAIIPQPEGTMHKLFAIGLIRAAVQRGARAVLDDPLVVRQLEDQRTRYEDMLKRATEGSRSVASDRLKTLQERVVRWETDSGMKLEDWNLGNVGKLAKVLHETVGTGYGNVRSSLLQQKHTLSTLCEDIDAAIEALPVADFRSGG